MSHLSSYPPLNQNLTFMIPQVGPMNITFVDIDQFAQYGIRICINYASQIGASFTLLVVLLLTTPKEKRKTTIFVLNILSLLLNGIRTVMGSVYFTTPFWEAYAYFSGDFSQVPIGAYRNSVGADIFTLFVVVLVELSLFLQVKAVCVNMRPMHRNLVIGAAVAVGLTAIGFRLGLTIEDSIAIMNLNDFVDYTWLSATNNYLTTASICVFSFIFSVKLGYAIYRRRKMGLQQFGPMQIIFIMGCQTLFIPAVFSILENFTSAPELGSQALTITVLFLPLSSLWAASAVKHPSAATNSVPKSPSDSFKLLKSFRSFSTSGRPWSKKGSVSANITEFRGPAFGQLDSRNESVEIQHDRSIDSHFHLV